MRGFLFALISLCLAPAVALAQAQPTHTCPQIIIQVLQTVDSACTDLSRNQACYGNVNIQVEPATGATDVQFEQIGDTVDVSDVSALRLSALNEETNEWGVAVMQLQANLPNTLPGQNVTFLLFGEVEIVNAVGPTIDANPMQAFFLSTGTGEQRCNEAPQDGVLVQTPEGIGQVSFSVNGVDVAMGSTIYLQAHPNDRMRVSTLQGSAVLRHEDTLYPVIAGTWATFPIDESLAITGEPTIASYEDFPEFDPFTLPLSLLPQEIEPVTDISTAQVNELRANWEKRGTLCFEGSPVDCEDLIDILGGDRCALNDEGDFDCDIDFDISWDEESLPTYANFNADEPDEDGDDDDTSASDDGQDDYDD